MERKRIEIEAKFPLLNKDLAIQKLNTVGEKTETNNLQKDVYYTPAHKNFLDAKPISEWLRLRKTASEITINYKNWGNHNGNNKISCKEIEVGIDDLNGMLQIFEALELKEIIVVEKNRNSWKYKDIIISIDEITNLGDYIELEFASNLFEDENESLEYIKDVIKELGINVGEQIFAGYPQLVMAKNNY